MSGQVYLFGSFSEVEAKFFQSDFPAQGGVFPDESKEVSHPSENKVPNGTLSPSQSSHRLLPPVQSSYLYPAPPYDPAVIAPAAGSGEGLMRPYLVPGEQVQAPGELPWGRPNVSGLGMGLGVNPQLSNYGIYPPIHPPPPWGHHGGYSPAAFGMHPSMQYPTVHAVIPPAVGFPASVPRQLLQENPPQWASATPFAPARPVVPPGTLPAWHVHHLPDARMLVPPTLTPTLTPPLTLPYVEPPLVTVSEPQPAIVVMDGGLPSVPVENEWPQQPILVDAPPPPPPVEPRRLPFPNDIAASALPPSGVAGADSSLVTPEGGTFAVEAEYAAQEEVSGHALSAPFEVVPSGLAEAISVTQAVSPQVEPSQAAPQFLPPPASPPVQTPRPAPKSWAALLAPKTGSSSAQNARISAAQLPGVNPLTARASGCATPGSLESSKATVTKAALPSRAANNVLPPDGTNPSAPAQSGSLGDLLGPGAWQRSLAAGSHGQNLRLQPRGLLNSGNSCFLNSTLQALVSCPPFLYLLQLLGSVQLPPEFPTVRAFADFVKAFEVSPAPLSCPPEKANKGVKSSPGLDVGRPFSPSMFEEVLSRFSPHYRPGGQNRQEDAHEFLSFVMDRMHEELLRLQGSSDADSAVPQRTWMPNQQEGADADEEWETVGPKNKTAVTRTHSLSESALSDIFGGQLRSVVKTKGNKASATVQPFLVLQLDIVPDSVHSVEEALQLFAAPETLDGYRARPGNAETVSASKAVKIQSLPRILILHLMRFSYGAVGGTGKLHKPIKFPPTLPLGRELLVNAAAAAPAEARRYELVATVTHHGKDPSGGHYTTDARQLADSRWLRFDDGQVSTVPTSRVFHDQAYLLFYRCLKA